MERRIIILLLCLLTLSCRSKVLLHFNRMHDSAHYHYVRANCYFKCNKGDSALIEDDIASKLSDSLNADYYRMYPDESAVKDDNCNCK